MKKETKLYTEEQLYYICKSISEKFCQYDIDPDVMEEEIENHDYSKLFIKKESNRNFDIDEIQDEDNISKIELIFFKTFEY